MKAKPFIAWLCREIRNRHLSIRQIGLESGIHPTTIQRWVLGQTEPDDTNVGLLAKYFHVDRSVILRLLGRLDATTTIELTEEEVVILRLYRTLSRNERARLMRAFNAIRDEPVDE